MVTDRKQCVESFGYVLLAYEQALWPVVPACIEGPGIKNEVLGDMCRLCACMVSTGSCGCALHLLACDQTPWPVVLACLEGLGTER